MTALELDHLVVVADRLADGVAHAEAALGVAMAPGGRHPGMGTHNALLHLGTAYLEVIAPDPDAPPPGRARMFGLDGGAGVPRLAHWVARVDDMPAALALAPEGVGPPLRLSRGDLEWDLTVPGDGRLPHAGLFPALIDWGGAPHPLTRLPDAGCRLREVTLFAAQPDALRAALSRFDGGWADRVQRAATPRLAATIDAPRGPRVLS